MAEQTQCPQCQRTLNVQEAQLGQTVQCPVCGACFAAEAVAAPRRPAPPPPVEERAPPRRSEDRPAYQRPAYDRRDDRDDDYPPPRYDRERDDDYRRRGYGRPRRAYDPDARPHRGALVLILGILSIVLSFPILGQVLGIFACAMGNGDLGDMNRGRMDESGRGMTQGGLICGIIGIVLSSLGCFCFLPMLIGVLEKM
jgi:hypothetical protein